MWFSIIVCLPEQVTHVMQEPYTTVLFEDSLTEHDNLKVTDKTEKYELSLQFSILALFVKPIF